MVDETGQAIQAQRQALTQAQQVAQQAQQKYLVTPAQARAGGFQSIPQRLQMGQQYKVAREYGGRIAQATTQFEQEVAQKAPEYAIQQYKEQAIQEAKARIAPRVQQLKESIASKQARVEEIEKEGGSLRDTRKERYAVAELQAELNVLESGLQGDPNELIKGYYSGNLQAKAKFERQKEEAKNERRLSPKTETIEYQPVKGVYTASGKFYPTTAKGWLPQTAQEGIVPGEKVIYTTSKEGVTTPTSIKSEFFKETIPIGEYNKKIEEYNKALEMPQVSKGALPEYILKDVPTGGTVIREGYGTTLASAGAPKGIIQGLSEGAGQVSMKLLKGYSKLVAPSVPWSSVGQREVFATETITTPTGERVLVPKDYYKGITTFTGGAIPKPIQAPALVTFFKGATPSGESGVFIQKLPEFSFPFETRGTSLLTPEGIKAPSQKEIVTTYFPAPPKLTYAGVSEATSSVSRFYKSGIIMGAEKGATSATRLVFPDRMVLDLDKGVAFRESKAEKVGQFVGGVARVAVGFIPETRGQAIAMGAGLKFLSTGFKYVPTLISVAFIPTGVTGTKELVTGLRTGQAEMAGMGLAQATLGFLPSAVIGKRKFWDYPEYKVSTGEITPMTDVYIKQEGVTVSTKMTLPSGERVDMVAVRVKTEKGIEERYARAAELQAGVENIKTYRFVTRGARPIFDILGFEKPSFVGKGVEVSYKTMFGRQEAVAKYSQKQYETSLKELTKRYKELPEIKQLEEQLKQKGLSDKEIKTKVENKAETIARDYLRTTRPQQTISTVEGAKAIVTYPPERFVLAGIKQDAWIKRTIEAEPGKFIKTLAREPRQTQFKVSGELIETKASAGKEGGEVGTIDVFKTATETRELWKPLGKQTKREIGLTAIKLDIDKPTGIKGIIQIPGQKIVLNLGEQVSYQRYSELDIGRDITKPFKKVKLIPSESKVNVFSYEPRTETLMDFLTGKVTTRVRTSKFGEEGWQIVSEKPLGVQQETTNFFKRIGQGGKKSSEAYIKSLYEPTRGDLIKDLRSYEKVHRRYKDPYYKQKINEISNKLDATPEPMRGISSSQQILKQIKTQDFSKTMAGAQATLNKIIQTPKLNMAIEQKVNQDIMQMKQVERLNQRMAQRLNEKLQFTQTQIMQMKQVERLNHRMTQRFNEKLQFRQIQRMQMKQVERLNHRMTQRFIEKLQFRQIQRMQMKQVERLNQRMAQRLITSPRRASRRPVPPRPIPPRPISPLPTSQDRKKPQRRIMPKGKPGVFQVELRRGGKFMTVGKAGTAEQAVAIGKQAARQTLGASFRVKGEKGYLGLKPGEEFRLGRGKDSGITLVQRAPSRIKTLGEIKEIKLARRGIKLW